MPARGPELGPGDVLPGTKYEVVQKLGAGGMGVVYQVVKPPSIQGVLKLMGAELTAHEEFRTRFFDEVRVLSQLEHPNVVRVFDYDSLSDGTPFYVMELLHGRTVRDVLCTMGRLPSRVAFEITRQLCEALHCAHTHTIPVVHRDIKPENIFLHAPRHGDPVLKLIDFGVAGVADRKHDGTFVGTWRYAAPEQIRGERPTPATDLYAVGLVLYEMLCGVGPFEHLESGVVVAQAHLRDVPEPVSTLAPWVPPSIVELIAAALEKDPAKRPRDAYAFAERLYELEWASDGDDARAPREGDTTTEGPLSRALSEARAEPSRLASTPAPDRLGDVPRIGVPRTAKRDGPTVPGVGGNDTATPDEASLLAGLLARRDLEPLRKGSSRSARGEREASPRSAGDAEEVRPGPRGLAAHAKTAETMEAPASERPRAPRAREEETATSPRAVHAERRTSLGRRAAVAGLVASVAISALGLLVWRSSETPTAPAVAPSSAESTTVTSGTGASDEPSARAATATPPTLEGATPPTPIDPSPPAIAPVEPATRATRATSSKPASRTTGTPSATERPSATPSPAASGAEDTSFLRRM